MNFVKFLRTPFLRNTSGRLLPAFNPEGPGTASQICVGRELHSLVKQEANARMRRQTIPEKIKKEVAYRAWKYGMPEARKWGDKKYPEYKFKRETVRDWKFKYEKYCKENLAVSANSSQSLFAMPQRGKPSLISEELSTEIKQILSSLRVAGCSISRKVVISVGNGVLASRCSEKMSRNGGKISLTEKNCRKGFQHKIHNDLILNFDQTPLGFTCPAKTTFMEKTQKLFLLEI